MYCTISIALNQTIALKQLCQVIEKNYNKDNVKIQWTILHKTNKGIPFKPESCSTCNLERIAIAEAEV